MSEFVVVWSEKKRFVSPSHGGFHDKLLVVSAVVDVVVVWLFVSPPQLPSKNKTTIVALQGLRTNGTRRISHNQS
jgi:hypothetical protein